MTHSSRIQRLSEKRAMYVRSGPYNILPNDPDGWVANQSGPIRWGDWPRATQGGTPGWYLGDDSGGAAWAIGPNGPNLSGSALLPAVTRCTGIIVSSIVRTPWRYTNARGEVLPRPIWVDDPMGAGRMPGPIGATVPAGLRLDGASFFETWLTHALWWGKGVFVYVENAAGEPTPGTLRLLNPFLVEADDDGHWVIDPNGETPIRTNFDGRFIAGGQIWRLAVLRGMAPNDGRTPEGVLTRHWDTLRIGASVSEYVASTFSGMGVPSGLLKVSTPGFKSTDAEELKASWMRSHGNGRRGIAVLNASVEFQPISLNPVDADVEKMVHVSRTDIAHAFGLSSAMLDEGASGLTYTNLESKRRDLVDTSLSGWSESMMATLSSLVGYGSRIEVDWASYTQSSVETLMPSLVQGVQAGILTAEEARQYIGLVRKSGPDPAFTDTSKAVTGDAVPALEGAPA